MCTIPPPPPPPPQQNQQVTDHSSVMDANNDNAQKQANNLCGWSSHDIGLHNIHKEIGLPAPPFQLQYRNIQSIIQVGPTCGLVALSMMLDGEVAPDELLNIARVEGYSSNGEMLSCKDMLKLTEKAISLIEADNVTCTLRRGGLYSQEIIEELLDGALLLVPYDADYNHYPCERHGHTAHWALVTGVAILEDTGNSGYTYLEKNVYVLCRHGKSRYLSTWLLEDLDRSNRNLWEFSPNKMKDGLLYIIPEGGIGGEDGLRDQFLVIKGF